MRLLGHSSVSGKLAQYINIKSVPYSLLTFLTRGDSLDKRAKSSAQQHVLPVDDGPGACADLETCWDVATVATTSAVCSASLTPVCTLSRSQQNKTVLRRSSHAPLHSSCNDALCMLQRSASSDYLVRQGVHCMTVVRTYFVHDAHGVQMDAMYIPQTSSTPEHAW